MTRIRPVRPDDGAALQAIERLAGERFRDLGMDAVADDEPLTLEAFAAYAAAGRGWVAVDHRDNPIGYAIAEVVDDAAHVEQITVLPDRQGRGVGRSLLDEVRRWAHDRGLQAVTLTTFDAVPWNRPLYEHLGFRVLAEAEITPGLAAVRAREEGQGLDPRGRVCMRLDVVD